MEKGKQVLVDLNSDIADDILHDFENDEYQYMDFHQKIKDELASNEAIASKDELTSVEDIAMREDLTSTEVLAMTFISHEAAGQFYNTYGRYAGFSVHKDDLKHDKNNMPISRRWVCSREGYRSVKNVERVERSREPRGLTRVGCKATFRVKFDRKTQKWVVKEFVMDHNHELVTQCGVPFLRSHRRVKSPDRAQAISLRNVGMHTSHIRDFMLQQSGGYQNVGFTTKDLYNDMTSYRKEELRDGDAEGALAYLTAKELLILGRFDISTRLQVLW